MPISYFQGAMLGLLQGSDPAGSKYIEILATAESQVCGQAIQDDACGYDDGTFAVSCGVDDFYTVVWTYIEPYNPDLGTCGIPEGCLIGVFPQSYDLRACPVTGPGVYKKAAGASGLWS